ncbi:MAG: aminotransferase class III-fold pyridoxal phosphate-dependent enzyme [Gammaproteobacteria bacterium]|nr:aminotransferase class III-fold pyridoxal phosphate-dependent enzyme [Gammaproteobacteria bacterium]
MKTDSIASALEDARQRYCAANPLSMAADKAAEKYLPGGNTRTVLHYDPFPLTMVAGEGAELTDMDGHRYLDCVGEFSAGLFGHSNRVIISRLHEILDKGMVMGAPTAHERELAGLLCDRFPSIEQLRFCNSGTESNIMALSTARIATGRNKFLAFHGAYHGGVMVFAPGGSQLNIPFDFVLADYNDIEATENLLRCHGNELAAVIVEPVLGAGGSIPGSSDFLEMLCRLTNEVGALLIFDEVKTARLGKAGVQGMLGIEPDLTTLGKFIGGGLPTGAFGGKAEIMAHFNPKQKDSLKHAGTFNNNVCSMAAGSIAMGEIFTQQCAEGFLACTEAFRISLNELFAKKALPMYCNGLGSIFTVHFTHSPIQTTNDISPRSRALSPLLHMEMLLQGILICSRGDLFLSLPMTAAQFSKIRAALEVFIDRYRPLIIAEIGSVSNIA